MDQYTSKTIITPLGQQLAFPYIFEIAEEGIAGRITNKYIHAGMTKREFFAAEALKGVLAGKYCSIFNEHTPEKAATHALQCADALLNLLEGKK